MRRYFILSLLLAVVYVPQLDAQAPPPSPAKAGNWGSVRDGKFVSERLGLGLDIPPGYHLISDAEANVLADAGADLLKQGTASEKRLDEAIGRTIRLVAFAEKPIGSSQNSALEIVAVKQQNGVTARMSLAANVALLSGTPYSLKRSLGLIRLGPRNFAAAELEGNFSGVKLMQRMYVVMHKGYSIVCAVTYFTDQQRSDMEKVLSTLSLKT